MTTATRFGRLLLTAALLFCASPAWAAPLLEKQSLFANPDNLENKLVKPGGVSHDRKRLTVKRSYDECKSWPVSKVLEEGPSGYCDLAVLPDRTILCMYECGTRDGWCKNKNIAQARFNVAWLADGRDPPLRLADAAAPDLETLPTRAEIQRAAQTPTCRPATGWHALTTRSVGWACPAETATCRRAATPRDGMPPTGALPKQALHWAKLPSIPGQEGFAGAFAGASGGALIVAGGTNITAKRWGEDFVKTWYDSAFVLDSPQAAWQTGFKLPCPIAYGVSITAPDGLICVGGSDGRRHRAEVFRLQWRAGRLDHARLPDLPGPCANACGTLLGTSIYLAGGQAAPDATSALHTFWQLDLAAKDPRWVALEPWPGPERMLAVAGALRGSFYLLSGTRLKAGPQGKAVRAYLRDAYCFTPGQGWRHLADLPRAAVAAPSPAVAAGDSLLVPSGDDGLHLDFQPLEKHPGFPRDVLAYNAQTGVWSVAGAAPFSLAVAPAVSWLGRVVIANGEARPRVRTPEVWSLTLQ